MSLFRLPPGISLHLRAIVLGALGLLGSCASAARSSEMIPPLLELPGERGGSVDVVVHGGEPTNPMWTSEIGSDELRVALEQAILRHGPYVDVGGVTSAAGASEHRLVVEILEVEQPIFALDIEVAMQARWTLFDCATDVRLWAQEVLTRHTTEFGEHFYAVARLRLANEGAGRRNIADGLTALAAAELGPESASPLP